jgi:hypothetical protein
VNDTDGCSVCGLPCHVRDAREEHVLRALVLHSRALSAVLADIAAETRAAGALVSRGKLLALADGAAEGGEGAPGTYELACCSLDAFMRLDAAAVRALNLLPATGRDAAAAAVVESSAQGYTAAGSSSG